MYCHDLTELLNRDAAAYTYFYSLSPKTQALLQGRDIRTLDELHRAAEELRVRRRPDVF